MAEENHVHIDGDLSVEGDFIKGNKITYVTQYLLMQPFTPPANLSELRTAYLDYLRRVYRVLDFRGIPQLENFSRELLLEEVYVPLLASPTMPKGETWERRLAGRVMDPETLPAEALAPIEEENPSPVRIEEVLGKESRVVVLGDPGSGKSTLLKYIALRLASEANAPLPILMPLNAYARFLNSGEELNLQAYLPRYFASQAQGISNLEPLFESAILNGQAVILLDGLDEIQKDRSHLVQKIEIFAGEAASRGNKLVVTSRIVGYNETRLASQWSHHTLLDFSPQDIENFASRWCLAFEKSALGDTPEARSLAEKERRALLAAVETNPGVARLASNPLLLTILALIKRQGVSLPNRRVKLYDLYLETLISSWNKARALDRYPVGPDIDSGEILQVLGPLALWLRETNPTAGVVPEDALLRELSRIYASPEWGFPLGQARKQAHDFLKSVHQYSNLLVERGYEQYGFLHLTLEEMLAAYGIYLRGQLDLKHSLSLIQKHLTKPGWRETILLAVGLWGLAKNQPRVAAEVVRGMLKMECAAADACQNVLLAGACLEDVGETGLGRPATNEILQALQDAALNRSLPPPTQRDAGFILGRLAGGSPDMLRRIRPDLDDFVSIEAEKPFAIAKYPLTNLQYRRFIEDGGYENKDWWSADGWSWRVGTWDTRAPQEYQSWLSNRPPEKRNEPFLWRDSRWNNPLAPVVGVSWFEAEAYCIWYSAQPGKHLVRLPAEQEWELAAGGKPQREYAWGNDFNRNKLNCAEFWADEQDLSQLNQWKKWYESESFQSASITMVGQFPGGATPEKVYDLSGNVWEWTASWFDAEQIYRVVRGGSWNSGGWNARCAFRSGFVPGLFNITVGFRLVSPGIFLDSGS
jgi:formylglycine-generating enzyme required for sulfatase activity/energy-coupling factor transporter ATP-binding protein EcfA2